MIERLAFEELVAKLGSPGSHFIVVGIHSNFLLVPLPLCSGQR